MLFPRSSNYLRSEKARDYPLTELLWFTSYSGVF
jgi:hypothetical protein